MISSRRLFSFPNAEAVLQKYIDEKKPVIIADRKHGERKVLPIKITQDFFNGKCLLCHVISVSLLGNNGNHTDNIFIKDIIDIHQ